MQKLFFNNNEIHNKNIKYRIIYIGAGTIQMGFLYLK